MYHLGFYDLSGMCLVFVIWSTKKGSTLFKTFIMMAIITYAGSEVCDSEDMLLDAAGHLYQQLCSTLCNVACLCGVVYLLLTVLHYKRDTEQTRLQAILSAVLTIISSLLVKYSPTTAFHVIYNIGCTNGVMMIIGGAALTLSSYRSDNVEQQHIIRTGCCFSGVSTVAKAIVYTLDYSFS